MERLGLPIWLIVFVLSLVFGASQFRDGLVIDTNFEKIFQEPSLTQENTVGEAVSGAEWASRRLNSRLDRETIFAYKYSTVEELKKRFPVQATALCKSKVLDQCRWQKQSLDIDEVYSFYRPYRQYLILKKDQKELTKDSFVIERYRKIQSPVAILENAELDSDPMGILSSFLSQLIVDREFAHESGFLVRPYEKSYYAFVFALVSAEVSPSEKLFSKFFEKHKSVGNENILVSSRYVQVARNTGLAISELVWLMILSLSLIALLMLLSFKSLKPVIATVLTVSWSCYAGFVCCQLFYPQVHIICLILGIGFIGAMASYCIFYFTHSNKNEFEYEAMTFRKISAPLFFGLLVVILGFLGPYFSEVAVLEQLSLFLVGSFVASGLSVAFLFPYCKFENKSQQSIPGVFFLVISQIKNSLFSFSILMRPLVVIVLVVGVFFASQVSFDDESRKLVKSQASAESSQRELLAALGRVPPPTHYLVQADSVENLLRTEEALADKITQTTRDPELSAISSWIPSLAEQRKSAEVYKKLPLLTTQLYLKLGVNKAKETAGWIYRDRKTAHLQFEVWRSQFAQLTVNQQFLGSYDNQFFSVFEQKNGQRLEGDSLPSGVFLPIKKGASQAYFSRPRLRLLLFLGILFVLLVAILFFTIGLSRVTDLLLAPCVGLVWSILFCGLLFGAVDFFHLLGIVFVFFISLSNNFFANFVSHGYGDSVDIGIGLSMVATLMSLTVLTSSSVPAVQHLGVGGLSALVFSYMFINRKRLVL